jgi:peroxiredoxin
VINRPIPDVTLKTRVRDDNVAAPNPFRWHDFRVRDAFAGKKVVVFSLPGAFTPTCSNEQCPNYERLYDEFKALGVDEVYCVSVNDAFVMYQWGKNLGVRNVKLLPDGNGELHTPNGHADRQEPSRLWPPQLALCYGGRRQRHHELVREPGINDVGADEDPYGETAPEKLLEELKAQNLTVGRKEPA